MIDLLGNPIREPGRKPVVYTVRTDPAQVDMFGTRDAAIQAQAARDAARPRAGQQPANEGLFAPATTEQEGLF